MPTNILAPWVADTDRDSWGGPLPPAIKNSEGHDIAKIECREPKIYLPDDSDVDYAAMDERDRSLCRLMAAAPEMLEACKAFVALFRDSDMRPEDECHEVYADMIAAIYKATGEHI
jgi:hypothetical protein